MLRDDAIRKGLIEPTKADIERMNLTDAESLSLMNQTTAITPESSQILHTADEGEGVQAVIDLGDLTYRELQKKAEELGIDLPNKYIKKDALIELILAKL